PDPGAGRNVTENRLQPSALIGQSGGCGVQCGRGERRIVEAAFPWVDRAWNVLDHRRRRGIAVDKRRTAAVYESVPEGFGEPQDADSLRRQAGISGGRTRGCG